MPIISIIIPVYNVENYIRECLDSLIQQDLSTCEVICVNDGSTDNSLAILQEYQVAYPNVFKVFSQLNQGQSVARNMAIDEAKGQYLVFLDSDDYFRPNAIETIKTYILTYPHVDVFYLDTAITSKGKRLREVPHQMSVKMSLVEFYDYFYAQTNTCPQGCVWAYIVKNDFVKKNNIKMLSGVRYEDELFCFELFTKEGICMCQHLDKPYYYYRVGRLGSTTAHYTLQHFYDRRTIVHYCYAMMNEMNLRTIARKRQIFGLCEENLLEAYIYGFKAEISKFFSKRERDILHACITRQIDKKVYRLAMCSPILLAAYRTDRLPRIIRRIINRFF